MERDHTISGAQFFGMMFVSRVTITIALNAQYAAGDSLLDAIPAYLLAMAVGFLLAVPVWMLHRQQPGMPVGEVAVRLLGQPGKVIPLLYSVYFLVMSGVSLALFQLFLMDNVNPDFPAVFILIALVGVAVYGAWQGLESIARTAACILVLLLLGTTLVFSLVVPRFNSENLEPLFAGGTRQLFQGAALFLSRTSLFAEMAVLLPFVKGRTVLGFSAWAGGTSLFVAVLVLLIAGCLGPYAYTQNFPVYALASITGSNSMQRLDAVFTGMWMMGLIVQAASGLYAIRICAASMGQHRRRWVILPAGVLMVLLGWAIASSYQLQTVFMDTDLWLLFTAVAGAGIPIVLLLVGKLKGKGGA